MKEKKLLALEKTKILFKYNCNWFCDTNRRKQKKNETKTKLKSISLLFR